MREVPEYFERKREKWKGLSERWFRKSNTLGIVLVILYSLTASLGGAAPWAQLRWRVIAVTLPILAAVVSYLGGTYNAQAKGTAFELAAREIEKAEALYRTDEARGERELGKAEEQGILLLSIFKLN